MPDFTSCSSWGLVENQNFDHPYGKIELGLLGVDYKKTNTHSVAEVFNKSRNMDSHVSDKIKKKWPQADGAELQKLYTQSVQFRTSLAQDAFDEQKFWLKPDDSAKDAFGTYFKTDPKQLPHGSNDTILLQIKSSINEFFLEFPRV